MFQVAITPIYPLPRGAVPLTGFYTDKPKNRSLRVASLFDIVDNKLILLQLYPIGMLLLAYSSRYIPHRFTLLWLMSLPFTGTDKMTVLRGETHTCRLRLDERLPVSQVSDERGAYCSRSNDPFLCPYEGQAGNQVSWSSDIPPVASNRLR